MKILYIMSWGIKYWEKKKEKLEKKKRKKKRELVNSTHEIFIIKQRNTPPVW